MSNNPKYARSAYNPITKQDKIKMNVVIVLMFIGLVMIASVI